MLVLAACLLCFLALAVLGLARSRGILVLAWKVTVVLVAARCALWAILLALGWWRGVLMQSQIGLAGYGTIILCALAAWGLKARQHGLRPHY